MARLVASACNRNGTVSLLRNTEFLRLSAISVVSCRRCCMLVRDDVSGQPPRQNLTAKMYRYQKLETLRRNRRDPDLERKAREQQLYVPLEEVRKECLDVRWGRGLHQLETAGNHSNIYQDVFGDIFRPLGFLEVLYPEHNKVSWGNLIEAKNTLSQPQVTLPAHLLGNYATLILTDPDGHLQEGSGELLHWMVTNIPLNDGHGNVSHGSPLVPYLPPIPPKGTGFHRYVFSLYTHTNLLPSDSTHVGITKEEGWLQQRLFSSAEFVETMKDFRPYTFSFFQSQWDHSVSQTYKHLLRYPEPVYGPERILSPRNTRKKQVYAVRQSKYTNL